MEKALGAKLREEFPIFKNNLVKSGGKNLPLVYLDTAASAQKPRSVIDALVAQMEQHYGSVHRGVYNLSARASESYEGVRAKVAQFLSPTLSSQDIVFTRGTTESLNILAHGIASALLSEDSRIVVPAAEHHANLIPWQQAALRTNCEIAYIPLLGKKGNSLSLDLSVAEKVINKATKVVSLAHVGNVLGQINPVAEITRLAKAVGAIVIVDAAQSVSSVPDDLFALGVDAVCFSSHKMYGPSGVGVLAAKKTLLDSIPPLMFGGGMIRDVTLEGCEISESPSKFEAGTPPATEVFGLGAAIDWVQEVGRSRIHTHAAKLASQFHKGLESIPGIEVNSPSTGHETIISFHHTRVHAHDLATFLDSENVAVRAGHHCAWPLIRSIGVDALVRASFAAYSDEDDVEVALNAIKKAVSYL